MERPGADDTAASVARPLTPAQTPRHIPREAPRYCIHINALGERKQNNQPSQAFVCCVLITISNTTLLSLFVLFSFSSAYADRSC
jgi:hypothetical protein